MTLIGELYYCFVSLFPCLVKNWNLTCISILCYQVLGGSMNILLNVNSFVPEVDGREMVVDYLASSY